MKIPLIDIHTHHPLDSDEIIPVESLFLQDINFQIPIKGFFSAAIHPWHAGLYSAQQVGDMLNHLTEQPGWIAIGETGLDKRCRADYLQQKILFELQLDFAIKHHKPVIIHAVKSWNDLIPYFKGANVPIVLHGYSGGPELTRQLIQLGCYFSIGNSLFNPSAQVRGSIRQIPFNLLFLETDDSQADIGSIYQEASKLLDCFTEELKIQINMNFIHLLES